MDKPPILLVHGAWVNGRCWDSFRERYAARGYTCHAPSWPHDERSVQELRNAPAPELAGVGIGEIVEHYRARAQELGDPILIGHSFGGLFVQRLVSMGIGRAAVAIDSAPPFGVLPSFAALRAAFPVVSTPGHWKKTLTMSEEDFGATFANGVPEADRAAAYDQYVIPTPGRVYAQATWSPKLVKVDFKKQDRCPLLLVAGSEDKTISASMNRANHGKYKPGPVTDFKEFEGRSHFLIAEPGWEEVADFVIDWVEQQLG